MQLSERQMIFAKNVGLLIGFIFSTPGYGCTLGEAYRTKEQAEWNAQKGTGVKNSLHCKRLAIDLNLFKDGIYQNKSEAYEKFADYWVSLHPDNKWGGVGADGNHFSMSDGKGW